MQPYNQKKYEKAKKRMEEIKGFYSHALVYVLVNLFILLAQFGVFSGNFRIGMPAWGYLTTPFFWGIGLLFHGLYVFQGNFSFLRRWEERKIQEYMDKEQQEIKESENWNDLTRK